MRTALSVIAGYAAMVVVVMVTFGIAFVALGADRAFLDGLFRPSMLWILVTFALGFGAATVGGLVAASIAKHSGGPNLLAAAVLILGLVSAALVLRQRVDSFPQIRPDGIAMSEAMENAEQPAWVAFTNPFIGVTGVLLGARLRRR